MKYFITSDIHSFYDELIFELNKKGYNKEDSNHILIVCGDIFDRGTKPLEVYNFLRNIPKERRILIKGNHEQLLKELVQRGYPANRDIHNRTYETLFYFCGFNPDIKDELLKDLYNNSKGTTEEIHQKYHDLSTKIDYELFHNDKLYEILEWLNSDEWINYYELDKYIFVHAFIPLFDGLDNRYNPNWRLSNDDEWYMASWGCPWKLYLEGNFEEEKNNGKILVCGHWHTSDFYNNLLYKDDYCKLSFTENPIFMHEDYNLIGLDACCAASKKLNVLVIEL